MELDEIKELIKILEESKLRKLLVKRGENEVLLEKEGVTYPSPIACHDNIAVSSNVSSDTITTQEGDYILSPMVGTFYMRSAPDQDTFVKVGDIVNEDTVVCIIEAMKVMNEIKAGVKGRVVDLLLTDAHPVEFGSKLFKIEKI